jgi:hypothetical protein
MGILGYADEKECADMQISDVQMKKIKTSVSRQC